MLEVWYEMKLFEKVSFVQKNLNNEDDFVYMYIGKALDRIVGYELS